MSPKIELLNIDCLEYMKGVPDKYFELAIVDPPYGLGMDGNNHPKGTALCFDKRSGKSNCIKRNNYTGKQWDIIPDKKYFDELKRVSKNQIIWGANHFTSKILIDSKCWIVWDKCNVGTHQSDCELAWASFGTAVRKFSFMWSGAWQGNPLNGEKMQGNKALNEERIHPTQKPVKLYKWLLHNYAEYGDKILDTHGGSRSLAIACYQMGFDHVSCEIDKDYHDDSVKRFKEQTMQQSLFK